MSPGPRSPIAASLLLSRWSHARRSLALAVLLLCPVLAQPAASEAPLDSFVPLSDDEGLTNSDVRAIAQDHDGFIWLGTRMGGLVRYDGHELKTHAHDPANPQGIGHNVIWSLLVDRRNAIWVGTEAGISRLEPDRSRFTHFRHDPGRADSLPNNVVTSLFEDASGRIWATTRDGLSRLDDASAGRFTTFRRPALIENSSRTNTFRSIIEDRETGLFWLGASDGLAAFDPRTGAFASYLHDPADPASLSNNAVNKVIRAPDGVFWALTENGLNAFKPELSAIPQHAVHQPQLRFRRYEQPTVGRQPGLSFLRDGLVDSKNRMWIATRGGLQLFDRATGTYVSYVRRPGDASSLSDDLAHTVFEDRGGNIWVGTYAGGASRLRSDSKPFRVDRHLPGDARTISEDRIVGLTFDPQGRLWVATTNGLCRRDPDGWTRFLHDPSDPASLPTNDLATVAAAPNGDIWIGTHYLGPIRYDGRRFHTFPVQPGNLPLPSGPQTLTGAQINSILPDANGGIWLGARAYGLDYYRNGTFEHFNPSDDPLRSPTFNVLFGSHPPDRTVWYATESQGLVCLDTQTHEFKLFDLPRGNSTPKTRTLVCVAVAADGLIWLGAADGLLVYDPRANRFLRHYTTADGLPNNAVMSVVHDRRGHIWAGTANGLADLDPKSGRIRTYNRADGIPSNVFSQRSAVLGPDGRVYLGTRAGIVSFDPAELKDRKEPPPVVITDVRWLGASRQSADPAAVAGSAVHGVLRVPAGQLGFSLRFAALDFTAPEKNQYRYRLEGWDDEWVSTTGRDRSATYTALPPGRYVFHVQASNADGAWNYTGATLPVVIEPHFWETLWFRLGGIALLTGIVIGAFRWRGNVARHNHRRLQELVSQRTAELKNEIAVRERAEAALRESHDQLERRVQERTAALAASHARVAAEMNERRKVEEQLRQSQKMEAVGQLAGGIAHDFNNLLTVILGQSELLSLGELQPALRADAIRDIKGAAQRAANLTRQLLVFSRRAPMRLTVVDLNTLVTGETDLLRRLIGEDIVLATSLAYEPLPVYADTGMLQQLLLNLVLNARDAMRQGGRLTLATARRTLTEPNPALSPNAVPGDYARLSISDTGAGIPQEVLSRIFEPFFTTKERGKGTGLGLAISHGIVQQHRGWFEVETTVGSGTTFHAWFPLGRAAPDPLPAGGAAERRAGGSATVLVVEDETQVRAIATRVLRHHGYQVLEATCGADALLQWSKHRDQISILLTDIIMPGQPNGHELAARLTAERPRLRVITMSGYDPDAAAVRTGASAARAVHLRKPFTVGDLLAVFAEQRHG